MTNRKSVLGVMWLGLAAMGLGLSACGSEASRPPEAGFTEEVVVGGVALTGASVAATVALHDSSAESRSRTVTTKSDGTFSIDVAELTPPYVLRVAWGEADSHELYAVAEGNENLDVTPITDLAASGAASGEDAARLFERSSPNEKRSAATRARALLASLTTELAPLFELYGITDPLADRDAVRALLQDVRIQRNDGMVTVTNRETGEVIFEAHLFDLASGTFNPDAMPGGSGVPPPTATCAAFTYSAWGTCQSSGTQSRGVLTSSPSGCTGGTPVTTQACTYTPPVLDGAALYQQYCAGCHGSSKLGSSASAIQGAIDANRGGMGSTALRALTTAQVAAIAAAGAPAPATCTSFTYSPWSACQANGSQTRSVLLSSPSGCTGGSPVTAQACTYVPPVTTCSSFSYSAWGSCQSNNTQSRTVLTSSPSGCTGGSPVTAQACTYTPPIDGAALYTQYCAGCHGNGKKGSSAAAIQGAIDSNRGGMGSTALRALTPAQVAAIAAAP